MCTYIGYVIPPQKQIKGQISDLLAKKARFNLKLFLPLPGFEDEAGQRPNKIIFNNKNFN